MRPATASLQDPTLWGAARSPQRNRGRFRPNCLAATGFVSAVLLTLLLLSQTNYGLALLLETTDQINAAQKEKIHKWASELRKETNSSTEAAIADANKRLEFCGNP
eukprot:GHVT01034985.1.p2 GENE.GHVT01034985.1~~GHVT01034985.1.p2  ORF type:complete len:106 (-),score=19.83 GHVT01034985.1:836-1153(-)